MTIAIAVLIILQAVTLALVVRPKKPTVSVNVAFNGSCLPNYIEQAIRDAVK